MDAVGTCHHLLEQPDIETALQVGDIYAVIVEYHVSTHNFKEAYSTVERMRERGVILSPYLDRAVIEQIHSEMGIPLVPEESGGGHTQMANFDDDGVDEDLEEEI